MIWRLWCLLCGLPLGALVALALPGATTALGVELAALSGGVVLVAIVSLIARVRDDDAARGAQLARACSLALVSLPALGLASRFGVAASWLLAAVVSTLAIALHRAAFVRGPCEVRHQLVALCVGPVVGGVLLLGLAALVSALGAEAPVFDQVRADAVYDLDARTPTLPLPGCAQQLAGTRVLERRGAHPRLSPTDELVWFDAAIDGRRQIFRHELASGESICWTCSQPGSNRRPAPDPAGSTLFFESDRHVSALEPANSELYRIRARGDEAPSSARRLTHHSGPDEQPQLGPSSSVVAWSRGSGSRRSLVTASLLSGHGGLSLTNPGVLYSGGAAWTGPLGWSRDARSLVVARGNPLRPLAALSLDLAAAEERVLAENVPAGSAVGFSADGGWVALATSQRDSVGGLLPDWLGFALPPDGARFRGTGLVTGATRGELHRVELAELGDWGEPTGLSLSRGGDRVVLGQRNPAGDERLVELTMTCSPPAERSGVSRASLGPGPQAQAPKGRAQ